LIRSRAQVVSSFTTIKGSLIDETYAAFRVWDLSYSKPVNLKRIREEDSVTSKSGSWRREVAAAIRRRFDPGGRDRPLVELAQAGCDREIWKPLLLWHMTRDDFLLRDFLSGWLYDRYVAGIWRLRTEDVARYLRGLGSRPGVRVAGSWSASTTSRVASGLLRIAVDFGLMTGRVVREFAPYHLPEESFIYLLHAMVEREANARKVVESSDWHMYLMDAADVEQELLRLHQYRRLHYEVAGSLARLDLPWRSAAEYARVLAS